MKIFHIAMKMKLYCLNLKVKLKKSCQIEIKENEIHHIPLLAFSVILYDMVVSNINIIISDFQFKINAQLYSFQRNL